MTFQEIKSLITNLQNASNPCMLLIDLIDEEWQIDNGVLHWQLLNLREEYDDEHEWNYSAEIFEGVVDKGHYTVVNVNLGTGVSVTMYLDNTKRIGE